MTACPVNSKNYFWIHYDHELYPYYRDVAITSHLGEASKTNVPLSPPDAVKQAKPQCTPGPLCAYSWNRHQDKTARARGECITIVYTKTCTEHGYHASMQIKRLVITANFVTCMARLFLFHGRFDDGQHFVLWLSGPQSVAKWYLITAK